MSSRRKKQPLAAVVPYIQQSIDESPVTVADVQHLHDVMVRPILTSRVVYDLTDGSADCHVELRDGTRAHLTMSRAQLRQPLGQELMDRVMTVHAALIVWGVGSPSWHRRDVGRAACLLLALLLPSDPGGFTDALSSPDRTAHYLNPGRPNV